MTKALPWWYNDESEAVLNRGYLLHGETIHDAIDRITGAAARRLYRPELQERFAGTHLQRLDELQFSRMVKSWHISWTSHLLFWLQHPRQHRRYYYQVG